MTFECRLCNVTVDSQKKLERHFETKKHKKNVVCVPVNEKSSDKISRNEFEKYKKTTNKILSEQIKKIESLERANSIQTEINRNQQIRLNALESSRKAALYEVYSVKSSEIKLNSFGNENLDYITQDYCFKMMSQCTFFVREVVKQLHFNENHPENHNLDVVNKGKNFIRTFDGKNWNRVNYNELIKYLIEDTFEKINTKYGCNFEEKNGSCFIGKRWKNKVEQIADDDHKYHDEVMLEEITKLKDSLFDLSDRLKNIKKERSIQSKELVDKKYQKHLSVFRDEEKRRLKIEEECLKTGDDLPEYEKTVEEYTIEIVKKHFET